MTPPSQRTAPSLKRATNGACWIAVPAWESLDWLWHGFSTRQGGVTTAYLLEGAEAGELNLGFTAHDSRENVQENRFRFVEAVTASRETPIVTARQVHSNRSARVDDLLSDAARAAIPGTTLVHDRDGLMTHEAGLLLGIQIADCIPVLVADPENRAVAAFHAGWRGTVERIVELGIAQMQAEFGSDPAHLISAIGPGIGPCCYTVGEEVIGRFSSNFAYADELFASAGGSAKRLDLIEANRRQLLDAGLPDGSISVAGGCTACHPEWFYSHRASGGHAGRMMAVIGIR